MIKKLFQNRYNGRAIEDTEEFQFSPDWVLASFFFAPIITIFLMKLNIALDEFNPLSPFLFLVMSIMLLLISGSFFLFRYIFRNRTEQSEWHIFIMIWLILVYWSISVYGVQYMSEGDSLEIFISWIKNWYSLVFIIGAWAVLHFTFIFFDQYIGNEIRSLFFAKIVEFLYPLIFIVFGFFIVYVGAFPSIALSVLMAWIYFYGFMTYYLYNTPSSLLV